MSTMLKQCGLVLAIVGVAAPFAHAQFQVVPPTPFRPQMTFGPNPMVSPGMTLQQYMLNMRAAAAMPGWNGYNPYAGAYVAPTTAAFNPMFNPVASPYGAAATNPYDPFTAASPSFAGSNPYATGGGWGGGGWGGGGGGFDPYMNPYMPYVDPFGGVLRGTADVMRAYGSNVNAFETARILREKALQERIRTARDRFDHEMYIKNNTPTFTEEQAKIARMTLKRIQTTNNLSEIWSAKSLNVLLNDLRKPNRRAVSMEPLPLADDVLKHINVTRTYGNLGLLRDSGQFNWPQALREVLPQDEMEKTQIRAQRLVKQAEEGSKLDPNVLKELRQDLERIRETLTKKVLEIPTSQYLQAKRFLNDFDEARFALENGEAGSYFKFQSFVDKGGKTLQDVVDYMVKEGLRFAPAVSGDEAAYQALHSALAAYDIAFNAQLVAVKE